MSSGTETIHHTGQARFLMPEGARQIILVRHGSSVGPTVNTLQLGELTLSDPELSPDGHLQAQALASQLSREAIAHIFVTPLRRTHQTAEPLVAATGIQPVVIDDLREIHLGEWEHSYYEYASSGHPLISQAYVEERWDVIPQAESAASFAERVSRGIAEVVARTGPGTTSVALSHAATISEICRQAARSRPFAFVGVENTSITRLIVTKDGGWQLRSFNDVSHLGYS
ncbi:MAG: histidine phosphatase family protein [Novosphingobium sp.]|uniref:histidine phosphatase family protein n=1 Tax=Tsuneonella sp. CC-YZS046 TaxID=3042152 RepID=UPI002D79A262|nr:histidine phosphatase family protein [Tsuneonella sp. CC-YZS046]WRO65858.1 histidine phosphatase family protein [Tsuneonella sp. CC-YZS046]